MADDQRPMTNDKLLSPAIQICIFIHVSLHPLHLVELLGVR